MATLGDLELNVLDTYFDHCVITEQTDIIFLTE